MLWSWRGAMRQVRRKFVGRVFGKFVECVIGKGLLGSIFRELVWGAIFEGFIERIFGELFSEGVFERGLLAACLEAIFGRRFEGGYLVEMEKFSS